jgi:hypothetical protein
MIGTTSRQRQHGAGDGLPNPPALPNLHAYPI